MKNLNYLRFYILYQIFKNIQEYFDCIIKKHQKVTRNPPIRIYVNKTKNRITFKLKQAIIPNS